MKRIAILLLIMCICTPGFTWDTQAMETERINGFIRVKKEIKPSEKSGSKKVLRNLARFLPTKYRSDEQEWAEGIKVKDQDNTGMCWAFSTITAAEYSWAKKSYRELGAVKEMSAGHLGYFYYNRVNDPLDNTEGDRNNISSVDSWPLIGGNMLYAAQHLATYSGIGLESDAPFELINSHVINDEWDKNYKPYDDELAYKNYATLKNSYICLGQGADVDIVKEKVYDYGAASIAVRFDTNKYMNLDETDEKGEKYKDGRSFYNYEDNGSNHGVTIIGWDDDYPASNFAHKVKRYSEEKSYEMTTPPGDGAWVVQNSWGYDSNDKGVFYMSYYSSDLIYDPLVVVFDMQAGNEYDYNFQYDGTADCGDASDDGNEKFFTKISSSAANIFTNTTGGPIEVSAVGFTTFTTDLGMYYISVYKNITDPTNPTSGQLVGITTATTDMAGTKTAVLDKPVPIDTDETYSVVFTFPKANNFGVEKERDDFEASVHKGQSFFRKRATAPWQDVADYDACFRIKALANSIDDYYEPEYETESETPIDPEDETTTVPVSETTAPSTVTPVTTYKKPGAVKIKKVRAKKKSAKKLSVTLKKVANANGYQVAVYKSKNNAKKNRAAIVRKLATKIKITLKSKALKNKKKLFVRARAYRKYSKTKVFGKWSGVKKVKIKK